MPSTTRGSILISTANDIGEALVEKLGGVGYSPNEWKEKYNLCGIAPVDSAPALSVLSDSAGTGDERGSILIATADAIGAILNKKYNVLRGFKPKEWASACRKMKALEEGSVVSASIASFSDGADTVPLTSCVCNIDANLTGVSSLETVHTDINIFNQQTEIGGYNTTDGEANNLTDRIRNIGFISVKPNAQYYFYNGTDIASQSNINIVVLCYNKNKQYTGSYYYRNKTQPILSNPSDSYYIRFYCATGYGTTYNNDISINYPATDTAYHSYKGETKTADLGRAVYGGSADIIKGEGKDGAAKIKFNELSWAYNAGYGRFQSNDLINVIKTPSSNDVPLDGLVAEGYVTTVASVASAQDRGIAVTTVSGYVLVYDSRYTDVETFLSAEGEKNIVYPLSTPEDFTFEPVKIDSFPGVNNIWSDCGNTAVEYYKAPTPYTRKTATGGIANFSDQRTDLPLTKAIANIAPSIAGKSEVNLYQGKKNLWEFGDKTVDQVAYIMLYLDKPLPKGTYTISCELTSTTTYCSFRFRKEDGSAIVSTSFQANVGRVSQTVTLTEPAYRIYIYSSLQAGGETTTWKDVQIEVGSSASAYVPYQAPTTYTAELGETVYGGSVDFVSGEEKKTGDKYDLGGLSWVADTNRSGVFYTTSISGVKSENCALICDSYTVDNSKNANTIVSGEMCSRPSYGTNRIFIKDDNFTGYTGDQVKTALSGKYAILELATPIESAIPGRVISPIEGVNNYWNDAGGDTEIQYFEDET